MPVITKTMRVQSAQVEIELQETSLANNTTSITIKSATSSAMGTNYTENITNKSVPYRATIIKKNTSGQIVSSEDVLVTAMSGTGNRTLTITRGVSIGTSGDGYCQVTAIPFSCTTGEKLFLRIHVDVENINNIRTNILDLDAQVTTNTSNIATNTSNIATNTSNIATNTANIATNTSNITALQNKMQAIARFEPVASISALKALNTTSESTWPDKGLIFVEGVNSVYALDRESTATPDDDLVVQPTTGTGRWVKVTGGLLNENDFASNSATKPPTQSSVRAYVRGFGYVQNASMTSIVGNQSNVAGLTLGHSGRYSTIPYLRYANINHDPRDFANMRVFYASESDVVTVDGSNNITGGTDYTWKTITTESGKRPVLATNQINAHRGTVFTRATPTALHLGNTCNFTSEMFSIFGVFNTTNVANAQVLLSNSTSTGNQGWVVLLSGSKLTIRTCQSTPAQQNTSSSVLLSNTWYMFSIIRTSTASFSIRINKSNDTATPGTHVDPSPSSQNFYIGNHAPNAATSSAFDGVIPTIIIYEANMTSHISKIEDYLTIKYNL